MDMVKSLKWAFKKEATQRETESKEAFELFNIDTQTDHDDRHSLCQDFLTW